MNTSGGFALMKSFCFVCAYWSSRAISVPEFAKSAFWMEVVLILNINIL